MENPIPDPQRSAPPIPLPTHAGPATGTGDNTLGGLIPTRNQNALWAYYIGLFSLVPVAGLIMAPAAVVLGVKGLRLAKSSPTAKGATHAWVGIVCGGFWTVIHYGALVLTVIAFAAAAK